MQSHPWGLLWRAAGVLAATWRRPPYGKLVLTLPVLFFLLALATAPAIGGSLRALREFPIGEPLVVVAGFAVSLLALARHRTLRDPLSRAVAAGFFGASALNWVWLLLRLLRASTGLPGTLAAALPQAHFYLTSVCPLFVLTAVLLGLRPSRRPALPASPLLLLAGSAAGALALGALVVGAVPVLALLGEPASTPLLRLGLGLPILFLAVLVAGRCLARQIADPDLLRDAIAFFALMTAGTYLAVILPLSSPAPLWFVFRASRMLTASGVLYCLLAEHAALLARERRHSEELLRLGVLGILVTSSLDVDRVLQSAVDGSWSLLRASGGRGVLYDPSSETLELRATAGAAAPLKGTRVPLGESLMGKAILENRAGIYADIRREPGAYLVAGARLHPVSAVVAPLAVQGRVLGAIGVYREGPATPGFGSADLDLLIRFANQAAVAIANAQLYDEGQRMTAALEQRTRELAESGERHRLLAENAQDAIVTADEEGRILLFNRKAEEVFGYGRQEVWGKNVTLLMPAEVIGRHREGLARYRATGRSRLVGGPPVELLGVRKDGREFPLELTLSAARRGPHLELTAIIRDITERKRVEAELEARTVRLREQTRELEEANRLLAETSRHKSGFLANVSHELRTPLNAVVGFGELLTDEAAGPLTAKQREYLRHILDGADQLLHLINDILDLSKVEAGRMALHLSEFVLSEALEAAVAAVGAQAAQKGLHVDVHTDPILPTIVADGLRFRQILANLLSNAVKFTPPGGRVSVAASLRPPDTVLVTVQDTGMGIAPEDAIRIFRPFEQVDATLAREQGGTGLGLPISKRLVELHGGRIWVESAGPGQGSTFSFTLPLGRPAIKPKVLVVDDDETVASAVAEIIRSLGYRVEVATDGWHALTRIEEEVPDLIVLDLKMPLLSGKEVLERVRAHERTRHVRVILLTGHLEDPESLESLHPDAFLTKPFSLPILRDAIQALLQRQEREERRPLT
ncbi:MAG TPA: ATP-binding protein [Candidatus Methylomirabilis sp.]|jgi:PAS domain S-box-containing protein|nr:ATP-binding protein [Candidatus Methylomirabilis sp.]